MDTSHNARISDAWRQHFRHAHLRRLALAEQAWRDELHASLDISFERKLKLRSAVGASAACIELDQAIANADRAYEDSILRSGGIR